MNGPRLRVVLAAFALLAVPTRAGDFYVDALFGDDANGGTSAIDAWQTITHALATVSAPPPGGSHAVHVAPGTYDAVLGESFPLVLSPGIQLLGTSGSAATFLDGGGAATDLVQMFSDVDGAGWVIGPDTRLEGFTLRHAMRGVYAWSTWLNVDPTLVDLHITGMSGEGILLGNFGDGGAGILQPTLEGIFLTGNDVGLHCTTWGGSTDIEMVCCSATGNTTDGVRIVASQNVGQLALRRCRVVGNSADGVRAESINFGVPKLTLEDTLLASNGGDGYEVGPDTGLFGSIWTSMTRTTVAHNSGVGVRIQDGLPGPLDAHPTTLESCILYGNGDDLVFDPTDSATVVNRCDIGDGDLAGKNDNFSADPDFVDAPGGDFRLRFGSPCAEVGDPATPAGMLDLSGLARPVDGDLDAFESPDVGAFELAPLFLDGPPRIGTTPTIEFWGPAGQPSLLHYAAGLPVTPPLQTSIGQIDLDLLATIYHGFGVAGPGPPGSIPGPIPPNPRIVGLSLTLQSLAGTGDPLFPVAITNSVPVTFEP